MDPKEALKRVQHICSKQEKCRLDIRNKLLSWKLPEKEAENIITILEKEGFVDEKRYAETFARDKFGLNKWGKRKIAYMLKQKNIPEHLILSSLDQIPDTEYEDLLLAEIVKKNMTIKSTKPGERKRKLIQFTLQRGFEYEVINKVLAKTDF